MMSWASAISSGRFSITSSIADNTSPRLITQDADIGMARAWRISSRSRASFSSAVCRSAIGNPYPRVGI
jgi:hypothetical protein